jgi:two-component system, NtrC family, nitrogen regulation sensor histidine kinase NtrY
VISRNLYLNILVRVILIILLSAGLGMLAISGKSIRILVIGVIVIISLAANLVHLLNSTNRKIRYFFDSVRDDDSTLSFSTTEKNPTVREICRNMNRVNQQIEKLKIDNRNQEQYFRVLIGHLPIGIITYDRKGMILHSNSSASRLLMCEVLTHIRQTERVDRSLYETIRTITPPERRLVQLNTERGKIVLSLKATSFAGNEGDLTILSVQDIKNELDEKETESWMKLIRVLMHEIMNSITPITSLSDTLSGIFNREGTEISPSELSKEEISATLNGLKVIKDQGRNMMSFVDSYRKLTRIPQPDRKLFRAADLLEHVKILSSSLENEGRTEVNFFLREYDLEIFADQSLICQVLINLIKNALESNAENPAGMIKVEAGRGADQRPEICVTDNGPGIPAENIDEIFVPFFTTRRNGSGLGLSISRQIMRTHGGNLSVSSIPGEKTSFCLSF